MSFLSRELILPILIGFSLTGVSAALLYFLYNKDDDISGKVTSCRNQIECLVPSQSVPAVIGRGGSMVKAIQEQTGTRIFFKEHNVDSPCRACVIRGSSEAVALAESMIRNVIANQPVIETYEMYIPQGACGKVIGRGGETIIQIQMKTSAKVLVESKELVKDKNGNRRVIIKGTAEQIASALSQIEDIVREYKQTRSELKASNSTRAPRGKVTPVAMAPSTPENTPKAVEKPVFETNDGFMEVYVSAMENPCQFWVQVVGSGTTNLDKLVSEMTDYYNDAENRELHAMKTVNVGQMVAAKFPVDNKWYRGEIMSVPDFDHCMVYFVDYGDRDVLQMKDIMGLRTDFLSLRLQAVECSLANVKSRDAEWSDEACNRFGTLACVAQWKVLVAKIRGYKERVMSYGNSRREGSPIPYMDLYDRNEDKDINIGRELINEGLAESEEGSWSAASSTLSLSKRSHDAPGASLTPPSAKRSVSEDTVSTSTPINSTTVQEINLITPKKTLKVVEEIDLVTPVKHDTRNFIDNEKKAYTDDGSGDHLRNLSGDHWPNGKPSVTKEFKIGKNVNIAPAGFESDMSQDSDELEMG